MEEVNGSPSNTKSFDMIGALHGSVLDLNKKRKLQNELFDLPIPKHTCFSQGSTPSSYTLQGYPEFIHPQPLILAKATDKDVSYSQPVSVEASNSFMDDSASIESISGTKSHNMPSSTSVIFGSDSSENQTYSLDGKEVQIRAVDDIDSLYNGGPINLRQILEEQLLEFGADTGYNENDLMEQSADNEIEDSIYSDGMNSKSYVLSSGRWNLDREEEASTRKPTIDKEFEQYFSMLML